MKIAEEIRRRAIDTLWGVALADAIGNRLEFLPNVNAQDVRAELKAPILYPTDDTQMTLFNYEGLLNGWGLNESALAWYRTQTEPMPPLTATGLSKFPTLYRREAPGVTCSSSCMALSRGLEVDNTSKGNGTVMRASPFAVVGTLLGWDRSRAFLEAKADAMVTHKHPFAAKASVLLVGIYYRLFEGMPFRQAVIQAMSDTGVNFGLGCPVSAVVRGKSAYNALLRTRSGWVAEEALAMSIAANLYSPQTFMDIITQAVAGEGTDSDTVASIAGGLAVASGVKFSVRDITACERLYSADAIHYTVGRLSTLSPTGA